MGTLWSFCCANGEGPWAGLVQASDGNLYGTTAAAGANGQGGTFFKITPAGALTTLYSFCAQSGCSDGGEPFAPPVEGSDGNFYGTTIAGGANPYGSCGVNGLSGCGTIYRITPAGTLTTLYTFCSKTNCADGIAPWPALVLGNDGNLYGATTGGGANSYGTIFKITPRGTFAILHNFEYSDGAYPEQPLIQAADGNFYGATNGGGLSGDGVVFKITPAGTLTTLYSFCALSGCADGIGPRGALVQANDGNFYGTALYGGAADAGTIFKITPTGALTTLYSFCPEGDCAGGADPYPALVQDTNGRFYGTTAFGGAIGTGTIFSLSVGLRPFVETQTNSRKVGAVVQILGQGFAGTTGVCFNRITATYTILSGTLLNATVPEGATTGFVTVTTPNGTLTSNKKFLVRP